MRFKSLEIPIYNAADNIRTLLQLTRAENCAKKLQQAICQKAHHQKKQLVSLLIKKARAIACAETGKAFRGLWAELTGEVPAGHKTASKKS